MLKQTLKIFHILINKGYIDRNEDKDIWKYYENPEVMKELEIMKDELDFELVRSGNRVYLTPTQDNDIFLKNLGII